MATLQQPVARIERSWPKEGISRIPYWIYTDPAVYDLEQQKIFQGPKPQSLIDDFLDQSGALLMAGKKRSRCFSQKLRDHLLGDFAQIGRLRRII